MIHTRSSHILPPPNTPFGHPLRSLWLLDPGNHFLNYGSFGTVPQGLTFPWR